MAASICAVIVNALQAFGSKGHRKVISPDQFLPKWVDEDVLFDRKEISSAESMKALLMGLVAKTGGKHKKRVGGSDD